jgi:hypothetical protein
MSKGSQVKTFVERQRFSGGKLPAVSRRQGIYQLFHHSMKLNKVLLPVVLSLIVLGAGCSFTQTVKVNTNVANSNGRIDQNTNRVGTVSYTGQDGKNALELLQASHQVDVSDQGFVNSIDGVKPSDREFWAFYVNNQQAQVGAKDYSSKNSDAIEWRLEKY